VQTAAGGVKRKLADRDPHSARALIAEAEDTLAISDHDGLDIVETWISENVLDALHVGVAEEETARLAEGMAEFLAGESHRGRVDDRQHAAKIIQQQRVEQNLDAVLQAAQKHVPLKIGRQAPESLHTPGHLLFEGCDVWRKEPVQLESVSFLLGESSSFIEQRIVQKLVTEKSSLNERTVG
jgi:hypothetical protein